MDLCLENVRVETSEKLTVGTTACQSVWRLLVWYGERIGSGPGGWIGRDEPERRSRRRPRQGRGKAMKPRAGPGDPGNRLASSGLPRVSFL
ncbi:uncharacterized protein [Saccopteryx leptura]|uniref:uncharacterized protein isoform X2 n=1 Tax=Saccopteryx leptura TaxID=249018 RepID=UPI00339BE12B